MLGEAIRVWAAGYIRKSVEVSSGGPFGCVRNPLYVGSFLIMLGYCVMANDLPVLIAAMALFCIFHGAAILYEEWYLTDLFREDFVSYCKSVPRLFPRWRATNSAAGYSLKQVFENKEHLSAIWVLVTILAFALRIIFT